MALELTYPHIEKAPGKPARLRRLPRIRVAQIVMDHLAHGWSGEEIRRQHPHLLPVEVYASLAYYYDHQDEIDAEIRSELEEAEKDGQRLQPSPFLLRMRARGNL
jgi:uncharacterized protein (DUF433 family)